MGHLSFMRCPYLLINEKGIIHYNIIDAIVWL